MTDSVQAGSVMKMVAAHEKIYVRETTGWYANWRWALVWMTQLVFFGLPWLNWNDRQLVLFDLAARKFYIFGIVLWPQELIFLAALLIISAFTFFLSSAIVGRIWCGFACPHTVYTEIFMWIERKIEGGRSARMLLDKEPGSARKFRKKALKHSAWALFAFWTGFTFVGYFTPTDVLLHELIAAALGPWEIFWISFYGLLTYLNAGWMREQICRYICPYSRFQSVMVDRDTLVITFDPVRSEPSDLMNQKSIARKSVVQNPQQGDCIECTLCIQVCPTGSDIRQGLQYDCMGCAACIDACNLVMDKIGSARGLIRYATENAINQRLSAQQIRQRILRPRVLLYAGVLGAMMAALAAALSMHVPMKLDVSRDRGALLREGEEGLVENVYRLHIVNTAERAHRYKIAVSGIDTITLATPGEVRLEATSSRTVPVRIHVAHGKGRVGSNEIVFELQDQDDANLRVTEKAVFLVPRRSTIVETQ